MSEAVYPGGQGAIIGTRKVAAHPEAQTRVLALVTDAYGGYGGIAQYNRDFIFSLAAVPGVEQIDILPRLAPGEVAELPRATRQHPPIHARINYAIQSICLALKARPTLIFCGHLFHGPLAHLIAQITGAKLVIQLHGTEVWGEISAHHRRSIEAADLVLAVSRDTRARLLAKADVEPERACVLSNTVGADFTPGDRRAARARFGLTDEYVVLTVARLDTRDGYKGHDRIIPLVAKLRMEGKNVVYLIAGIGDDSARLEEIARRNGVLESVRFLGKVSRESLPDLYRAADLFALPSTGEGFGIAFLEAAACGTPTIGLAVGGAPDALIDGELGLCVSEEDFPAAFQNVLSIPRPDAIALSTKVETHFGREVFQLRTARALQLFCSR